MRQRQWTNEVWNVGIITEDDLRCYKRPEAVESIFENGSAISDFGDATSEGIQIVRFDLVDDFSLTFVT